MVKMEESISTNYATMVHGAGQMHVQNIQKNYKLII
jgi:hypothetical protein